MMKSRKSQVSSPQKSYMGCFLEFGSWSRWLSGSGPGTLLLLFVLSSCGSDDVPTPKPYAYFRIGFPEKKYEMFRDSCPFEFEYPSNYSIVLPDTDAMAEPCWKNIYYPKFRAELNLSYKKIENNGSLEKYLDDSWSLATKHQVKASGMPETPITRDSAKVYGLMFE